MIETKQRGSRGVLKGLFITLVAVIFVGLSAVLISHLLGIDLLTSSKQWMGQITHSNKNGDQKNTTTSQLLSLQHQVNSEVQQVRQAQSQLSQKDQQVKKLTNQVSKLQAKVKAAQVKASSTQQQNKVTSQDVADIYSNMNPSDAADILSTMKDKDAYSILIQLDNETKANILENMPVNKAASISLLLNKGN